MKYLFSLFYLLESLNVYVLYHLFGGEMNCVNLNYVKSCLFLFLFKDLKKQSNDIDEIWCIGFKGTYNRCSLGLTSGKTRVDVF